MTLKASGLVLLCWLLVASVWAAEAPKTVKLADVPAAVQKTIEKQAAGGKVGDIQRSVDDDGEVSFDVELNKEGIDRDFSVDAEGNLLTEQVQLTETPEAVQRTIKSKLTKGTLDSIDKNLDDEVTYDVQMTTRQGVERSFTVAEDGKLVSEQVGFEDLPVPVRVTVKQQAGAAKLADIYRELDEEGTYYDVTIIEDGKERGFTVAESGRLETVQVLLSETPPPVHKTIKQHIGNGKILTIDKVFDAKGAFIFSISGRKNGEDFDFSVGPKGGFIGRDN